MGGSCYCQSQAIYQQDLTYNLKLAQRFTQIQFTKEHYNKVGQKIYKKQEDQLIFQQFTVRYKSSVVSQQSQRSSLQRLIVQPRQYPSKGIIIYTDGFYIGKIQQDKANDQNGCLHIIDMQSIKYKIKGSWKKDCFQKGLLTIGETEDNPIGIHWNPTTKKIKIQINLRQYAAQALNQIQSYQGTINPSGKNLLEMLNGNGQLRFRDGSLYKGQIKDGLMHTDEQSGPATFITADQQEKHICRYKNGFRDGFGQAIINAQGTEYSFQIQWENGIPVVDTLKLNKRQKSVLRYKF